jgi:tRNA-splicing ligase RtcB (3'-phosphate/5'-hydroxy nucleic acid ligase)
MKKKELLNLGVPDGAAVAAVMKAMRAASKAGLRKKGIQGTVRRMAMQPRNYLEDPVFGEAAKALLENPGKNAPAAAGERGSPAPWKQWGRDIDPKAIDQMKNACRLPVAVAGALMPDAHVGYGLPIGGVLAVENAVIPYAVGVDIACRMKLTVLDLPDSALEKETGRLRDAIEKETRFGVGAEFKTPRRHPVMDEDWRISPVTAKQKDKAWKQLGTSGSGNHFADFGVLTLEADELGLNAGRYLALLTHSGSRGTGANVADYYSKRAMMLHSGLPKEQRHLAWLDLDSAEGREYWAAMELMGRYAAANHELIHRHIAAHLGADVLLDIENHHNFAWKERHLGREVVVHRKGATPAGPDAAGIIPGSMAAPGFVVRGRGQPESLDSAAHGAGRRMSRKQAKKQFSRHFMNETLAERGVTLMSAGLDEAPMAYKDISEVMAAQQDLVKVIARFDPVLVKMARG